jgi:hypothetical protein
MEAVAGVSIATILVAPILRFGFVENILVRIFLVGLIIYVIQKDVFVGLLTFLAVFTLLLERNHALALDLPNQNKNVLYSVNSEPSKADPVVETRVNFDEDLKDNIPRLEPAPKSIGAAAFFKGI